VDWVHLAQDMRPLAGLCEHGNEPLGSKKGKIFHDWPNVL
jgi:hypothetical protein